MELLIRRELEPGILELRLNRPDRLNALTASLTGELLEAFEALREDRAAGVVILTGAGHGFCSGADLQEPASPGDVPGTEGSSSLGFVYRFQEYLARLVLAAEVLLTGECSTGRRRVSFASSRTSSSPGRSRPRRSRSRAASPSIRSTARG